MYRGPNEKFAYTCWKPLNVWSNISKVPSIIVQSRNESMLPEWMTPTPGHVFGHGPLQVTHSPFFAVLFIGQVLTHAPLSLSKCSGQLRTHVAPYAYLPFDWKIFLIITTVFKHSQLIVEWFEIGFHEIQNRKKEIETHLLGLSPKDN